MRSSRKQQRPSCKPAADSTGGNGENGGPSRTGHVALPDSVEMMAVLRDWRNTLVESFTDRIGANKGRITEPHIAREIECIDGTMKALEERDRYGKYRQVILRALWNYDTQASREAYEAIHFGRGK